MYQLLKGVAHMHKHGVMHRDLKPQNLLVDDSVPHPLLKVADLGLGRHFTIPIKAYTHEVGGAGVCVCVGGGIVQERGVFGMEGGRCNQHAMALQAALSCMMCCVVLSWYRPALPAHHADRDAVVPRARGAAGRHALRARRRHLEHRLHLC